MNLLLNPFDVLAVGIFWNDYRPPIMLKLLEASNVLLSGGCNIISFDIYVEVFTISGSVIVIIDELLKPLD